MSQAQLGTPGPDDVIVESNQEELYDALPYESYPYLKTHPDNLYLVARLHGLNPPDFRTARVLELGCAGGGNLAPFAYLYPGSKCYGIDISEEELKHARHVKEQLKIANADFEKRNIMEISKEKDGVFDYIICHGILSWVPKPVQDKIFRICSEQLSENGLALLSFNAYPGWHAVRGVRDMLLHQTRDCKTPEEKIKKAHNILSFVTRNASPYSPGYAKFMQNENHLLSSVFQSYILHDHLGEVNDPLYLYEFNDNLEKNGLQFITDVDLHNFYPNFLADEARAKLRTISDRMERLQMIDFLRNQRFHSALIGRKGQKISEKPDGNLIFDYHFTVNARPSEANPDPAQTIKFVKLRFEHESFSSADRYLNEILLEMRLNASHPMKMDDIIASCMEATGLGDPEPFREAILKHGMELLFGGFINAFADAAPTVNYLSDKPRAHPYVHWLASTHPKASKIMSAHRTLIETDGFVNHVISYCDGNHTQEEIEQKMLERFKKKEMSLRDRNGLPITDPVQNRMLVQALVFRTLNNLAGGGIFVS